MEITQGMVVKSVSGHDGGSWYVVLNIKDNFAYIADGRDRKIIKPKKKNLKHLVKSREFIEINSVLTDKKLRDFLHSRNFPARNFPDCVKNAVAEED